MTRTGRTAWPAGWRSWMALLWLAGSLLAACPVRAQTHEQEVRIKAAYVFHALKYVDWPESRQGLRLCLLGSDEISVLLTDLNGKSVRDRWLEVSAVGPTELRSCQALYVARSERRAGEALQQLKGLSVLTVSDRDGFAQAGGMIGFVVDGNRVRLEINLMVAQGSNLKISSKLLELARIVVS